MTRRVTPFDNHLDVIAGHLPERSIAFSRPSDAGDRALTGRVALSTMHSAKGLEFPRLVVAAVNADAIPSRVTPEGVDPVQHAADVRCERCLLYVACTRARDRLAVTSSGSASPLLPG